jgi:transcriptional regulator GlxA family with amidase domain
MLRFSHGALLAAALGMVATTAAWTAVTALLAVGLVHPWPVAAPPEPLPMHPAAHDPTRETSRRTAAIVLSQAGTEITDFLAPYAILAASGAFTVHAVAPSRDVVPLNGGLGVLPDLTLDELDARHPDGVDVVVLPNVLDPESPVLHDWIRRQASHGARITSICEGARLLAATGLLDGQDATSHWAALGSLRDAHPAVRWHDDRRWVESGPFLTSAGVTAAIDASLQIVARAKSPDVAARVAAELHLPPPRDPASPAPRLPAGDVVTAMLEAGFSWPKRRVYVPLVDGIDELPLAATLDAWPRTFAARAASVAPGRRAVRARHGLVLVPMLDASVVRDGDLVIAATATGVPAFDAALLSIADQLGGAPAALAALLLELPAAHLRLDEHPTSRAAELAGFAVVLGVGATLGIGIRARWRRRRARPAPTATESALRGAAARS